MGEEGDCEDFQSAFICLPAIPRNCEHADEHFLQPHHVNLHVIVVDAGSETKTTQVSKLGELEKQQLKQCKPLRYMYNFFFPWCTVLHGTVNQLQK